MPHISPVEQRSLDVEFPTKIQLLYLCYILGIISRVAVIMYEK